MVSKFPKWGCSGVTSHVLTGMMLQVLVFPQFLQILRVASSTSSLQFPPAFSLTEFQDVFLHALLTPNLRDMIQFNLCISVHVLEFWVGNQPNKLDKTMRKLIFSASISMSFTRCLRFLVEGSNRPRLTASAAYSSCQISGSVTSAAGTSSTPRTTSRSRELCANLSWQFF